VTGLRATRLRARIIGAVFVGLLLGQQPAAGAEEFDYRLKDLDGVEHRASDSLGKWLVINFWATWCAPCLHEMPALEKFYRDNREIADLWGVTFEDTDIASIRGFVERLGISYPILGHGQDPKTGYGQVKVLPTTFVIDPEGNFYRRFEGPITASDLLAIVDADASKI